MAHLVSKLAFPLGGSTPSNAEARAAIVDALGQDILFTSDFQLAANGDYVIVEGYEALRQALRIRLVCRPGEIPWHPTFGVGLSDYVGELGTPSKQEQLKRAIRANFLDDPRLTAVTACDVAEKTINGVVMLIVFVRVALATNEDQSFTFREAAL